MNISEVYDKYVDGVFKYLYIRTENKALAEDLTSKTFEKIVKKFQTYDPTKAAISTWVYTIAGNTLTDYYRSSYSKKTTNIDMENENGMGQSNIGNKEMEKDVELSVNSIALYEAISQLTPEEQALVHMKYTKELSYKEISAELDLSVNAVGVRLHRIIDKLGKDNNLKKVVI